MPGIDLRSSGLAASVFICGAISLAHRGLCRELLSTFCLLLPSHHEVSKQSFLLHTAHHVILLLHRSKPKEPANHWAEVYEMEPHQSSFPISCVYLLKFVSDKKLTNTDFVLFSKEVSCSRNTKEQFGTSYPPLVSCKSQFALQLIFGVLRS